MHTVIGLQTAREVALPSVLAGGEDARDINDARY